MQRSGIVRWPDSRKIRSTYQVRNLTKRLYLEEFGRLERSVVDSYDFNGDAELFGYDQDALRGSRRGVSVYLEHHSCSGQVLTVWRRVL